MVKITAYQKTIEYTFHFKFLLKLHCSSSDLKHLYERKELDEVL